MYGCGHSILLEQVCVCGMHVFKCMRCMCDILTCRGECLQVCTHRRMLIYAVVNVWGLQNVCMPYVWACKSTGFENTRAQTGMCIHAHMGRVGAVFIQSS